MEGDEDAPSSSRLDPSSSRSFTPLSTLALPTPHVLHPQSCNPAMDLVVLLAPVQPGSAAPTSVKGKERASVADMSGWRGTKVALWRMLGSRVWEIEVKGWVAGLAWSLDAARKAVLEHRSVHTGEEVKVVPLDLPESVWEDGLASGRGIDMEWRENDLKWKNPRDGSAGQIIASLPKVTPVEPPKPAVNNPFAKASAASMSNLPHAKLSTFPSLLASTTTFPPHTLHISLTHMDLCLLTGSFPCPSSLDFTHLRLGQSADMLATYLNTTLRALEAMEAAWREGYKQTMLWREELEDCGKLQGIPDVHADLFRLLMTGRCREAVSEWLGNKLTGRMLTKWEQALMSSVEVIQVVMTQSVSPALERIMIILQELRGWSKSPSHSAGLKLDADSIERSINLTGGFIELVERMRQDAEHEALAAAAWVAWLKYETAQAGSGGGDEAPIATHDLKLTWSFLVNGFVRSVFSTYFPDNTSRPPTEELPESYISSLNPNITAEPLDKILSLTLSRLSEKPARGALQSPAVDTDEGMSLDQSSMMLSSGDGSRTMDESGVDLDGDDEGGMNVDEGIIESDDDSIGTAGKGGGEGEGREEEVERVLEMEPWVWANSLIKTTEWLIRSAMDVEAGAAHGRGMLKGMMSVRRVGEETWGGSIGEDGASLSVFRVDTVKLGSKFSLSGGTFLALQFFDDLELAIIIERPDGRYLATIDYPSYADEMASVLPGQEDHMSTLAVEFRRSRYLGSIPTAVPGKEADEEPISLALNGRKGRRVGCVVGVQQGGEVEVWDMEGDEDDDEEDGEEGGEEDESM